MDSIFSYSYLCHLYPNIPRTGNGAYHIMGVIVGRRRSGNSGMFHRVLPRIPEMPNLGILGYIKATGGELLDIGALVQILILILLNVCEKSVTRKEGQTMGYG